MLSREIASSIFQVFGMTRSGLEHLSTSYKASILPLGHGRHGDNCINTCFEKIFNEKNQPIMLIVNSDGSFRTTCDIVL